MDGVDSRSGAFETAPRGSQTDNENLQLGTSLISVEPAFHSPEQRRRSLRDPRISPVCPRSISLPQALHSFSLSGRGISNTRKRSHEAAQCNTSMEHGTATSIILGPTNTCSSSHSHGASSSHPVSSHCASSHCTSCTPAPSCSNAGFPYLNSTDLSAAATAGSVESAVGLDDTSNYDHRCPSSPIAKRAVSESQPRFMGRGKSAPTLVDYLCGNETDILNPLPKVNFQTRGDFSSQLPPLPGLKTDKVYSPFSKHFDLGAHPGAAQRALSNPDILRCIFEALDALTVIPHELVQQRRKPLSLRHAQLIFGDSKKALDAWETSQPITSAETPGSGLYNCILVNSVWNDAACKVLEKNIHFRSNNQWVQFARRGVLSLKRKPHILVLHKLNEATQVELDMMDSFKLGEHLEWLEFYTCAGLAPTPSLLGPALKRIILPGCYRVNDRTLVHIAESCPQLEHLDVRACEQVTDRGIKMISKYCPQLQLLNVGRTRGGEHITYKGIKHLARQTQITTLGIAGCSIDDRAIWELALNRGPHLQRLSLNNCRLLTDASVPRVLGYMPNVTVLEIRGCTNITHMRPLALFKAYREKQGQPPLIEGCEIIERRLQVAIMRLQRETSQRILADLTTWIDESD